MSNLSTFRRHPVAERAAFKSAQVERRIGVLEARCRGRDRVDLAPGAYEGPRLDSGHVIGIRQSQPAISL